MTNKTAHTPGPWLLDERFVEGKWGQSDRWVCEITCSNNNLIVADIPEYRTYPEEAAEVEANARLIAAAPDLLEVAKRSAFALTSAGVDSNANSDNPLEVLLHTTIAAIAKATGAPA